MTNSIDPDQTPSCAASDQGLYCLRRLSEYLGQIGDQFLPRHTKVSPGIFG